MLNNRSATREDAPLETNETTEATEIWLNDTRRPFDVRPFERLRQSAPHDPPYRPWWVVEPRTE